MVLDKTGTQQIEKRHGQAWTESDKKLRNWRGWENNEQGRTIDGMNGRSGMGCKRMELKREHGKKS
jgi:hypothetical protein